MHRIYKRMSDQLSTLADSFIGDPPDAAPVPYTFVWGPYPTKESSSLAGVRGEVDFDAHVTVVAASPANVLQLASQVEAILDDAEPIIAGWKVFPLVVVGSEQVQTSRGVFEADTNRYPAWMVLHVRVRAVRTGVDNG